MPRRAKTVLDAPPADIAAKRRSRLGEILVENGEITATQLEHALAEQAKLKLPIGKVLLKLGYLTEEVMLQSLATQIGVPFVDLNGVTIDRTLARLVHRPYARRNALVPIAKVGRTLTVAMDDPTAQAVIEELERMTAFTITVVTASSAAIQVCQQLLYSESESGNGSDTPPRGIRLPAGVADPRTASQANGPVTQRADELFQRLVAQAIDEGTSDIHLETQPSGLQVRFRIDGVLRQTVASLQSVLDQNKREIISRIKILSKLDIAERRRPQDGSFQTTVMRNSESLVVDLRVSVVPTYHGESVVIRILDRTRSPKSIADLGLSAPVAARLDELLERTSGIFLVTGPTGSGKSTTLGACLMKLHQPTVRILTAEDPVEYVYQGLSQSEVNPEIGNTFATYLRAFLRHDPEVIMVGEIRDQETTEMSLRAAQTGHLLLSTLHTNSAIAALPRLLDLNAESSLIASSLIGVLCQRLVRQICAECSEEDTPPIEVISAFFDEIPDGLTFYRGKGCKTCGQSGYKGRMMLGDLWVPDEQDLMLIARQASFEDVRVSAERTTFSMAQDVHERLRAGVTTLEELLRVLPYATVAEHRARFSAEKR